MRSFNVLKAMQLGRGVLCVLQETDTPIIPHAVALPTPNKILRFIVDREEHYDLTSIRELPLLLNLFNISLLVELEANVSQFAAILAAGAFPDTGSVVTEQPWQWNNGTVKGDHAIRWADQKPQIVGETIQFLAQFRSGLRHDVPDRICRVTVSLQTFETDREELATFIVKLA